MQLRVAVEPVLEAPFDHFILNISIYLSQAIDQSHLIGKLRVVPGSAGGLEIVYDGVSVIIARRPCLQKLARERKLKKVKNKS